MTLHYSTAHHSSSYLFHLQLLWDRWPCPISITLPYCFFLINLHWCFSFLLLSLLFPCNYVTTLFFLFHYCTISVLAFTACKDSQWKEEKQIMSPGGIFWANLNTPDLCKDQCVMLPQCLAVDMMNEGSRVLCYHHIKTFSLREVIKVAGASQNTIITRCGTAGKFHLLFLFSNWVWVQR